MRQSIVITAKRQFLATRNGKLHFPSKKVKNNEKDCDDEK